MCMDVLGNEKNKYKKVSTKERVWKLKYENRISSRRAENIETRPNGNLTWKQEKKRKKETQNDFCKEKSSHNL